MSSGRSVWIGLIILLISVSLSGCGPSSQQQTATAVALTAAVPTRTPTVAPTSTISVDTYIDNALVHIQQGDFDLAIEDYNRVITLDPEYAYAYLFRGFAYSETGDGLRARADYDQAIALDPQLIEAYYLRGISYAAQGEYDSAIADFSQTLALDQDHALAYYYRGMLYWMTGDLDYAISDIARALETGLPSEFEQDAIDSLVLLDFELSYRIAHTTPYPVAYGFPELGLSEYLETTAAGFMTRVPDLGSPWKVTYSISVNFLQDLPADAYLEIHFQDPLDPSKAMVLVPLGPFADQQYFESQAITGVNCKNYWMDIHIYRDSTKKIELGRHVQWINASFNIDEVQSIADLAGGSTCNP